MTTTNPCIITVAITGSLPPRSDNPAVPISVAEQVESTQAAFEAGATLVHLHVRNDDGTPTSAPERFAAVLEGIRKHCPGMITQVSTGGRSGAGTRARRHAARCAPTWPRSPPARSTSRPASTRTRPTWSTGSPAR